MALNEALLPEFDLEMANTRKTLERVPDEKLGWKPHEKSGTMGWLAGHVANIPSWPVMGPRRTKASFSLPSARKHLRIVEHATSC